MGNNTRTPAVRRGQSRGTPGPMQEIIDKVRNGTSEKDVRDRQIIFEISGVDIKIEDESPATGVVGISRDTEGRQD